MNAHPKVDAYLQRQSSWQQEQEALRELLLASPLLEDYKWSKPCYTHQGKNVAIIQSFKDCCALLFTKGALLADPQAILKAPGSNTQSAKRLEFTSLAQVKKAKSQIVALIKAAIKVEESGEKVTFKSTEDYPVPEELSEVLGSDAEYKAAFNALTPGRQRGYLLHFAEAKQASTRSARVAKLRDKVLAGKGYNER